MYDKIHYKKKKKIKKKKEAFLSSLAQSVSLIDVLSQYPQ